MTPDDAETARERSILAERSGMSVVIATYHGAKRVPNVLAAHAARTAPAGAFEVAVGENNSTDSFGDREA